ncbi:hypothetical protein LWM68_21300 [Niabella sp. W65]|nr:hypothetical protein [Niabella sp. W65]MCH7365068.1 hypothetical protein [Niabella sp. W65]
MTLEQFTNATEMRQIKAIWRGKLIAERREDQITYRLFKIDGFFVEAKINPLPGFARDFRPIEDEENAMRPYLPEPVSLNYSLF